MTTQNALEVIGISVDGVSRETLVAIVRRLQAENERLRENAKIISELERRLAVAVDTLKDAKEKISDWGEYASAYFQEKYDLKGDIEHINGVLATLETKN